MPNQPLPLVAAACLCEKVLTEQDGVVSVIRMVDTFIVGAPPTVLEQWNPHLAFTLFLALKARECVGTQQITVQIHGPVTSQEPRTIEAVFPKGPLATVNLHVAFAIGIVKNFGEARIDISFNGEPLTSVPFRIVQAPEQVAEKTPSS